MMDAKMKQFEAKLKEQMRRLEAGLEETNKRFDSIFYALAGNAYTILPAIGQSSQHLATQNTPQPITKQKKRNQKTRLQYKKRRSLHVTVQEVDHSEVSSGVKACKQVVSESSTRSWTRRSSWLLASCWHVVIPGDEKKSPVGSTQNECGAAEMPRFGIG